MKNYLVLMTLIATSLSEATVVLDIDDKELDTSTQNTLRTQQFSLGDNLNACSDDNMPFLDKKIEYNSDYIIPGIGKRLSISQFFDPFGQIPNRESALPSIILHSDQNIAEEVVKQFCIKNNIDKSDDCEESITIEALNELMYKIPKVSNMHSLFVDDVKKYYLDIRNKIEKRKTKQRKIKEIITKAVNYEQKTIIPPSLRGVYGIVLKISLIKEENFKMPSPPKNIIIKDQKKKNETSYQAEPKFFDEDIQKVLHKEIVSFNQKLDHIIQKKDNKQYRNPLKSMIQ